MGNLDILRDAEDLGTAAPDSPALKSVASLVAEWDDTTANIKRMEARLSELNARRLEIERNSLPLAMTEAGVSAFVSSSGRTVKIEQVVNGNIPAQSTVDKAKGEDRTRLLTRRAQALSIVRERWPGLIKTEVSVSLGRGEAEQALRIAGLIRDQFQLEPSVDETIHPATLNSHFKEMMEAGNLGDIPVEPFALYVGPIAKIK